MITKQASIIYKERQVGKILSKREIKGVDNVNDSIHKTRCTDSVTVVSLLYNGLVHWSDADNYGNNTVLYDLLVSCIRKTKVLHDFLLAKRSEDQYFIWLPFVRAFRKPVFYMLFCWQCVRQTKIFIWLHVVWAFGKPMIYISFIWQCVRNTNIL